MTASTLDTWSDVEILAALQDGGSIRQAAKILGVSEQAIRRAKKTRALVEDHPVITPNRTPFERPSLTVKGDEAVLISEASDRLGDIEDLMRARGLDPDEWIITNVVVNEWDAMRGSVHDNEIVAMHQMKVSLKRKLNILILSPATHVPPVKRTGRVAKGEATYTLLESDHQVPFQDMRLHEASLKLVADIEPHELLFIGDLLDFSTISRHGDHPATNGVTPQMCIDGGYRILRDNREASPSTTIKKLKGNHDWRLESEQLHRAERIYDICPAEEDIAALDLRRLLHLEELEIELVVSPRGWEHAEIEIVPGPLGLVCRHGWLTGNNTAERSVKARGRSMIVGHIHKREHSFFWDPSIETERVGATIGCMCLVRNDRYPHYVACDRWLQGLAMVTSWADGSFIVEHIPWDGNTLRWRNERYTA